MLKGGQKQTGFTIVELLIVIVIIGILAAVTVVAYSTIQQRARDSRRVSDISTIAKAVYRWGIETSQDFSGMPSGYNAVVASGWYNTSYSTNSFKGVLVDAGYLKNTIDDPIDTKSAPARAYMIAPCIDGDNKTRILMTNMETTQSQTIAQQLGSPACTSSTYSSFVSSYGMDYGLRVSL
ncbi:MAG: hypothetical protein QG649_679 [Patescibacteria group bacterium]|jgi:prepilin-type N-terminal cleavage/methylation domain-containing protein|nr:hypothetical protein [Patescibacteria group bacterium]